MAHAIGKNSNNFWIEYNDSPGHEIKKNIYDF